MEWWQIALLALAIVWALQILGTWRQMQHYRAVMGDIQRRWRDGAVGVGNSKGRRGKGVILILVAAPDGLVRRVMVMEGRTVLATFVPLPQFEGRTLESLRDGSAFADDAGRREALARAVEQIDRIAAEPGVQGLAGLKAEPA